MKIHITLTPLMLLICCSQISYSMDAVGVLIRHHQHAAFRGGFATTNPAESPSHQTAPTSFRKLRKAADRTAMARKERKMAGKLKKLAQEKKAADDLAQREAVLREQEKALRDAARHASLQAAKRLEEEQWERAMLSQQHTDDDNDASDCFFKRCCSRRRQTIKTD